MSTSVTLTGRIGNEPNLKFMNNGEPVCSFNIVTDRSFKNKDGEWENTDTTWWHCSAWRQLAENVADTFRKGDAVIIVGNASTSEYQAKDGTTRQSLDVRVFHAGLNERFNRKSQPIDVIRDSQSKNWTDTNAPF